MIWLSDNLSRGVFPHLHCFMTSFYKPPSVRATICFIPTACSAYTYYYKTFSHYHFVIAFVTITPVFSPNDNWNMSYHITLLCLGVEIVSPTRYRQRDKLWIDIKIWKEGNVFVNVYSLSFLIRSQIFA